MTVTDLSLWVTTEVGTIHVCCGPVRALTDLAVRHMDARTVTAYDIGPCCNGGGGACAFDLFGEAHDIDKQVILGLALARAEGRDIGQPYRCEIHGGALTFGGCCETPDDSAVGA